MSSSRLARIAVFMGLGSLAACEYRYVDTKSDPWRDELRSVTETPPSCASTGRAVTCSDEEPPASCDLTVDRFKELIVVHRSVLLDRRARNDVEGSVWSFRSRMEDLAGDAAGGAALALSWLDQWRTTTAVGPDRAPVVPRPGVGHVLVDPWRAKGGSLADAPFRLIAIVNRPDLREEDQGCAGSGGELRFVYAATDLRTGQALEMTVIVEIPYPATRTPREWMSAWHALAQKPFGTDYNDALASLTSEITGNSSRDGWRIRTNEIALGAPDRLPWELREFALRSGAYGAQLEAIPLATTPRDDLDGSPSLDSWASDNERAVRSGVFVLPGGLQAGASSVPRPDFRWSSRTMSSEVRRAFSSATCNGCHGGEHTRGSTLPFQHIGPAGGSAEYYGAPDDGETRLSTWLHDPAGGDDELARRERSVARALCGTCDAETVTAGSSSGYDR